MNNLIVLGLQKLAGLLDKLVPLQGGRTILVAVLVAVGNIAGFLTKNIQAEVAGSNIATAVGIIFASLHKPKTG